LNPPPQGTRTPAPAAARSGVAAAARVYRGIAGFGLLFVPALAAGITGGRSVAAWLGQTLLAAVIVASLIAVGARAPAAGIPALAGRSLGAVWELAVTCWYLVGTVVGQVMIALVGGAFLAEAAGVPAPAGALLVALAALGLAAARPGRWSRVPALLLALGGIAVLTALVAVRPPLTALAPALEPTAEGVWRQGAGVFLITFAFIGEEGSVRVGEGAGAALASRIGWALAGVAAVGITYAVAAAIADTIRAGLPASAPADPGLLVQPLAPALRGVSATVAACACALVCSRNLGTLAALAGRAGAAAPGRWGPTQPGRWVEPGFGVAIVTGVALAATAGWRPELLILVPDAMALAIFALALVSALRTLPGHWRILPCLGLAGCLLMLPFAGPAMLWPLSVTAVVYALSRRERTVC
jgi:amino acid efflux transporter